MTLEKKHVLLGVTGGIAAYKSAELIRQLQASGAEVRVVMTQDAQAFITPLTLQTLSGHPVYHHLFDLEKESTMSHIALARWAEIILVAPATAHFMAKLAHGFADDLLSTLCLATSATIAIAPAMNQQMWLNPATQHNSHCLLERGITILGPDEGIQACGETGPGRMLEPDIIATSLHSLFEKTTSLQGTRWIVTAGPTQESIDPVRFISNHSSGKMGYALAEAACMSGANVTLISGPTQLTCSPSIQRINVTTASQMQQAVFEHIDQCDILVMSAAVSDYRVSHTAPQKLKKSDTALNLSLVPNMDILSSLSQLEKAPFLVGFAAETENVLPHAHDKLKKKKLNMIIANEVGREDSGFHADENEVTVLMPSQKPIHFPKQSKQQLANKLIKLIATNCRQTSQLVP